MKKHLSQSKPRRPNRSGYLINVGLDSFGNALPDTGKKAAENLSQSIVSRRDVWIGTRSSVSSAKEPEAATWWTRVGFSIPRLTLSASRHKQLIETQPNNENLETAETATVELEREQVAQVFKSLHNSFNEREARLDNRLRALESPAASDNKKPRISPLLFGGLLAGAGCIGAVLFIMTSMKDSMTQMSSNIQTMNQHMGLMATDTGSIAQDVHTMNDSMYFMNNNVANMNGNIGQMNHQVGNMAQTMAPIGDAAAPMGRFSKFFGFFFPF